MLAYGLWALAFAKHLGLNLTIALAPVLHNYLQPVYVSSILYG